MAVFRPAMRIKEITKVIQGETAVVGYALEVRNDVWSDAETIVTTAPRVTEDGEMRVFQYVRPYDVRRTEEAAALDAQTFIREQFNRQREPERDLREEKADCYQHSGYLSRPA